MPSLEVILAAAIVVSLVFYCLLGGADYGGGVWDLLARGPRAKAQRQVIAEALGPIWEANHVWLILVIVVLFTAFPPAFSAIATALHVPLTLLLVGIVLRGAAFIFRAHDRKEDDVQRTWGTLFAVASLVTPLLLGTAAGAIASGRLPAGAITSMADFFLPWLAPFPLAVGCLALVLFAYLAAVYLTLATEDAELREDFRRRALISGATAPAIALLVFWLSRTGAPDVWHGLSKERWGWVLQTMAGALAAGALLALWRRRFHVARICAAGEVALIICGWAMAQLPGLVPPDLTLYNSAAPQTTLMFLAGALAAGAVVLVPAFWYLFWVFKKN